MFTETVPSIVLANILSVAAALPFIAAQRFCRGNLRTLTSDMKPPAQLSSRERRLWSCRRPRRRGQD
jgi:hypothetical protein